RRVRARAARARVADQRDRARPVPRGHAPRCDGGRHRRGARADRRAPARPAPLSRAAPAAPGPAALVEVRRVGIDTFPASFVAGGTLMPPPVPAGPFTTLPLTALAPPRPRAVW